MSTYNPYFWEVQTDTAVLEQIPASQGLYHQSDQDRERRYAMSDFYQEVRPSVFGLIDTKLTQRPGAPPRLWVRPYSGFSI